MTASFCFVHAADLHLDSPWRDLRNGPPEVIGAVCQAPLAAWDALVALTIEQNAAFLLLAGDTCDPGERAVAAQRRFLDGLQRLSARGIPTFIVGGQTDPRGDWAAVPAWPDGVRWLGPGRAEPVDVAIAGRRVATIHGFSPAADLPLGELLTAATREADGVLHIGVLHASLEDDETPQSAWSCRLADLQAAGMDYWALGHDHRHRQAAPDGAPIIYPGTLQGRGFDAEEIGPKGACVVHVQDGQVAEAAIHPLDQIRAITMDVEVSPDWSETRRALQERALALRETHAGRNVLVRAFLRGARRAGTAGWVDRPAERLLETLRAREHGVHPLVWWDSILDLTDVEVDETVDEQTGCGHVRALAGMLRQDTGTFENFLSNQVAPVTRPEGLFDEPKLNGAEVHDLLTRAERIALDLLASEAP